MYKLAMYIVPDAVVNDSDMVWEVHRSSCDEHGYKDEEDKIEDELLGRRQHVKGECDFILVFLELKPADKGGYVGFARPRR